MKQRNDRGVRSIASRVAIIGTTRRSGPAIGMTLGFVKGLGGVGEVADTGHESSVATNQP